MLFARDISGELRTGRPEPIGMQKSADGTGGTRSAYRRPKRLAEGLTGCWTEAMHLDSS
jgi:hypothetical protein